MTHARTGRIRLHRVRPPRRRQQRTAQLRGHRRRAQGGGAAASCHTHHHPPPHAAPTAYPPTAGRGGAAAAGGSGPGSTRRSAEGSGDISGTSSPRARRARTKAGGEPPGARAPRAAARAACGVYGGGREEGRGGAERSALRAPRTCAHGWGGAAARQESAGGGGAAARAAGASSERPLVSSGRPRNGRSYLRVAGPRPPRVPVLPPPPPATPMPPGAGGALPLHQPSLASGPSPVLICRVTGEEVAASSPFLTACLERWGLLTPWLRGGLRNGVLEGREGSGLDFEGSRPQEAGGDWPLAAAPFEVPLLCRAPGRI